MVYLWTNGESFHGYVIHNQRVHLFTHGFSCIFSSSLNPEDSQCCPAFDRLRHWNTQKRPKLLCKALPQKSPWEQCNPFAEEDESEGIVTDFNKCASSRCPHGKQTTCLLKLYSLIIAVCLHIFRGPMSLCFHQRTFFVSTKSPSRFNRTARQNRSNNNDYQWLMSWWENPWFII